MDFVPPVGEDAQAALGAARVAVLVGVGDDVLIATQSLSHQEAEFLFIHSIVLVVSGRMWVRQLTQTGAPLNIRSMENWKKAGRW